MIVSSITVTFCSLELVVFLLDIINRVSRKEGGRRRRGEREQGREGGAGGEGGGNNCGAMGWES